MVEMQMSKGFTIKIAHATIYINASISMLQ